MFFPWKLLSLFLFSVCVYLVGQVCVHMCACGQRTIFRFIPRSPPTVFFKAGSLPGLVSSIRLDWLASESQGLPVTYSPLPWLQTHATAPRLFTRAQTQILGLVEQALSWLSQLPSYVITIWNCLNTINIWSNHPAFSLRAKWITGPQRLCELQSQPQSSLWLVSSSRLHNAKG